MRNWIRKLRGLPPIKSDNEVIIECQIACRKALREIERAKRQLDRPGITKDEADSLLQEIRLQQDVVDEKFEVLLERGLVRG